MEILVVVPARAGSKGVVKKNTKPLAGKPLIQYSLDVAGALFDKNDVLVSTDDEEVMAIAEKCGFEVPFKRPKELSGDHVSMYDVLLHALDYYESKKLKKVDTLILFQPTSPFRKPEQVLEALDLYKSSTEIDMVVSVKETKSNPYFVLFEEDEKGYLKKSKPSNYVRRQDAPKVWQYNGAIYIINTGALREKPLSQFEKVIKYEMDDFTSIDIDTKMDWAIAQFLIANNFDSINE